ncbi:hypothetical protein THAOC_23464, partial [Thalassiosira oceanica]
ALEALHRYGSISTRQEQCTARLNGGHFRNSQVRELNCRQLPEVSEAVMGGVLVDNEGDILHMLGAEPPSHGCGCLLGLFSSLYRTIPRFCNRMLVPYGIT